MYGDLAGYPCFRAGDMGITVARKKHRLEEHHAGVPDGGRTAEQGEDHLGDHQLDEKKQNRAYEQRQGKQGRQ
jgi:hypothetical protein